MQCAGNEVIHISENTNNGHINVRLNNRSIEFYVIQLSPLSLISARATGYVGNGNEGIDEFLRTIFKSIKYNMSLLI